MFHAKGKEWEHVILTGLAEQDFPLRQAPLQEERQRAYVAATRARSLLTLHCDAAKIPAGFQTT
uniref:3'-5' exonuclease n=1 Tax=Chromobacterium vaccinii TaxID=1108595 RepID=UPI0036F2E855